MIAHAASSYSGLETMLHMTCLDCSPDVIRSWLAKAKRLGIRNILALRGDSPHTDAAAPEAEVPRGGPDNDEDDQLGSSKTEEGPLKHASDLVRLIRASESPEDNFTVVVAGYPNGHPDAASYEEDLLHLKAKVDAGADFVITQLFFRASVFKKFSDDCRAVGIRCPIIPGILPIQSYDSLRHIVKLSGLEVPPEIHKVVQPMKGNDESIRNYGIHLAVTMVKDLFNSGYADGVHIYTLNREVAAISILKRLGLWKQHPAAKVLPFKLPADPKRQQQEEVRPIFWSKRSRTYVYRTRHWDEYPNGRWGNSASPAFGELKDYYLFYLASRSPKDELLQMWGAELSSEQVLQPW